MTGTRSEALRVLVVDDDEDHRFLLRRLFASAGITDLDEAGDGAAAVERAAAGQPALVVLDLAMPVLSGMEVLPALRDAAPGARVVVMSGFNRRRLVDAARRRGAVGFVQKGTPPARLVDDILLAAALTGSAATIAAARFPNDHHAPRDARRFVRGELDDADRDLLATVELLVSELVTNAVVHAGSEPEVAVHVGPDRLRVEVRDDDPAVPYQRTPDALRPGGRGLHLLDQLASRWGVDPFPDGKAMWFELDRTVAAEPH